MILKRLAEGIKNQDWFVVMVEVMIVVVGIFIGLQVTEWNENRKLKLEWVLTLENLGAEFTVNIRTLEEDRKSLEIRVGSAEKTLEMMLNCRIPDEKDEEFLNGLQVMRATIGIGLRTLVLEQAIADQRFLPFLTNERRQYLQELITWLEYMQKEADFYENLPFENLPETHEALSVVMNDSQSSIILQDTNIEFPLMTLLVLAIPFEEACKDQALLKSMSWWVIWQSGQRTGAKDLLDKFNEAKKSISEWARENS